MLHRLDLKSARYDPLSKTVVIDTNKAVLEVAHEALEAVARKELTGEEAVTRAIAERKRITQLANLLPADDGKIHITRTLLEQDGQWV